jgi:dihydrofolate reductase
MSAVNQSNNYANERSIGQDQRVILSGSQRRKEPMRRLIEITFMSLNGVIDAPDLVQEARRYFLSNEEHNKYQKERLFAADALLLGRKTYEVFSKAYPSMAKSDGGIPMDFVDRMNNITKYVASTSLKEASWNAKVIRGDIAEEVRKIKELPGKDIIKYGTGPLDSILFDQHLVDLLCIPVYPFVLSHGRHLFEELDLTTHLKLSEVKRFQNGTVVLEYFPSK